MATVLVYADRLKAHIDKLMRVFPLSRGLAALITRLNMLLISETQTDFSNEDAIISNLSDMTFDQALYLHVDDASAALFEYEHELYGTDAGKARADTLTSCTFPLKDCTGLAFMSPGKIHPLAIVASPNPSLTADEAAAMLAHIVMR